MTNLPGSLGVEEELKRGDPKFHVLCAVASGVVSFRMLPICKHTSMVLANGHLDVQTLVSSIYRPQERQYQPLSTNSTHGREVPSNFANTATGAKAFLPKLEDKSILNDLSKSD